MAQDKMDHGPKGDSSQKFGKGDEPGAGELCTNLPNPYGYGGTDAKPSYSKSKGLGTGRGGNQ